MISLILHGEELLHDLTDIICVLDLLVLYLMVIQWYTNIYM